MTYRAAEDQNDMIERFYENHRQLEASAARLSRLLDAPIPDAKAIQAARWDIATRIMQHIALEDRHLFGNLAKDARPAAVALGKRYQAEFAQHIADYADHAKAWTGDRVVADWDGYRAMTRKQLQLLTARIRLVETELFQLASGTPLDVAQTPSISWTKEAFAIKDSVARRP